jgi:hypothetical protein
MIYEIQVDFYVDSGKYNDMINWCFEEVGPVKNHSNIAIIDQCHWYTVSENCSGFINRYSKLKFCFDYEEDAVFFKLRWL